MAKRIKGTITLSSNDGQENQLKAPCAMVSNNGQDRTVPRSNYNQWIGHCRSLQDMYTFATKMFNDLWVANKDLIIKINNNKSSYGLMTNTNNY